jgi:nitrogen regulatory protein PII
VRESFGISLASEKDVVLIVAEKARKAAIMKAIMKNAGPGTQAGAICFSLPVTNVEGLRRIDAEDDKAEDKAEE